MPRYVLHVIHGDSQQLYHISEDLPDRHAAWREATVTAGQIPQGLDGKLTPERDWPMEVVDEG